MNNRRLLDIIRNSGFSCLCRARHKHESWPDLINVRPVNGEELAYIMKNIGEDQKIINSVVSKFRNLIDSKFPDVEVVILALTEVSMVYRKHIERLPKKHQSKHIFVDPLRELAKQIVYSYIVDGYRQSKVCQIPLDFDIESHWREKLFLKHTTRTRCVNSRRLPRFLRAATAR